MNSSDIGFLSVGCGAKGIVAARAGHHGGVSQIHTRSHESVTAFVAFREAIICRGVEGSVVDL
jgi:hypothetical protein